MTETPRVNRVSPDPQAGSRDGDAFAHPRAAQDEVLAAEEVAIQPSIAEAANPVAVADHPAHPGAGERVARRPRRSFVGLLGLDRFSGLYVWAALIVIFAIWVPHTFLSISNLKLVAGDQAITAMLSLGLIIPLAAGVFDLSFAGMAGVSVAVTAWLQSVHGQSPAVAALGAIAAAAFVGSANGFVVVRLKVNSFIATLGMSSLLAAAAYWITNGQQITSGFNQSFINFGTNSFLGLAYPFWVMIALALVIYVVIEYLPVGRYLYAVGGNAQAARLAGVRVNRIVFGSLVTSAVIAGVSGVVLMARLGLASSDTGPSYLLPAFSAVFLGSTQIRPGRVNVLGTLIAVYLLATGTDGLQLAGAPTYVNQIFNGGALIIAVALAARTHRRA
jgi:ribose transport system permease protein